jgi:hypothetical protein
MYKVERLFFGKADRCRLGARYAKVNAGRRLQLIAEFLSGGPCHVLAARIEPYALARRWQNRLQF